MHHNYFDFEINFVEQDLKGNLIILLREITFVVGESQPKVKGNPIEVTLGSVSKTFP